MNNRRMIKSFDRIKLIGKGGFAEIYLIKEKDSKELFAMKVIDKTKISEKQASLLENEIKILSYANHPNIIKLYQIINDAHNINLKYLILEYCNGGSLQNNLNQHMRICKQPFSEKLVQKIMKNILFGVKYLHDKGIIHRDLKLDNILLKYQNEFDLQNVNIYNAEIKITDFNISYYPNLHCPRTFVGTPANMAPSIVEEIMLPGKHYDEKVDIWSLGTLCYEILFGKPLFISKNNNQIYVDILSGNFSIPKTISIQARNFLFCMLKRQGINRLTATELLNHEFIVGDYHNFKRYDENTNKVINNLPNNNNKNMTDKINVNPNYNIATNKINMKRSATEPYNNNKNIKILNKFKMFPYINFSPICVGCGKNITDAMYKCSVCFGLNICQNCFFNLYKTHQHSFVKCRLVSKTDNNNNNTNHTKIIFTNEKGSIVFKILTNNIYPINEVINCYLKYINRNDLVNNYDNEFNFIYKSQLLNFNKNKKICDIFMNAEEYIQIRKIKLNYNNNFKNDY